MNLFEYFILKCNIQRFFNCHEKLIDERKKIIIHLVLESIQPCTSNSISVVFQLGKLTQKQLENVVVVVIRAVVKAATVEEEPCCLFTSDAVNECGRDVNEARSRSPHFAAWRIGVHPPFPSPPVCAALIIHFHSSAFQESEEQQYTTQPGERIKIWLRLARR